MAELVERLGHLSLTASAVLLPLLLLSALIQKRYTAKTCYVLWLALAVWLLLPVDWSLPEPAVTITVPEVPQVWTAPAEPVAATVVTGTSETVSEPARMTLPTLGQILTGTWLAGALGLLLWHGTGYLLVRCRLRVGSWEEPEDQVLMASLWKGEHGAPEVLRTEDTAAPLSLGLFRPLVFLPARLGEEETAMVLSHELTHVRRRDLWYKFLLLLVNAAHWFNPLVWWMCRQAGRNLEYCCDDAVVAGRDAAFRYDYGQILLRYAAHGAGLPLYATRLSSGGRQMKGRLMNLFLKKKTGVMLVAAVLCAAVAVGALVTVQSAQAETPMTAREALDTLAQSVTINDKELTFTIPAAYEKADDWRIQVSGRYQMKENGTMSVHLVDNDGTAGRWKGGEGAYSVPLTDYDLDQFESLTLWAFLTDESGQELEKEVDLLSARGTNGHDVILSGLDMSAAEPAWVWPVPEYQEVTETFDTRVHPITGKESSHDGVDISAPEGVAVLAVRSGTVAETGWDDTDGNYVLLDHGDGLTTLYGCLSAVSVQTGDAVAQGDVLGAVGQTGAATGPHLHLEAAQDGALYDPLTWFPVLPETALKPEAITIQGLTLTCNGHAYDLTERSPAITAVTKMQWVGEELLLECHTGPENNLYLVFDPQTETFVKELAGTHLNWKGEDLTTGVYAFWGDICTWDGTVLATVDLGTDGYVSDLSFTDSGDQVEVTVTQNEVSSTQLVSLT
ncbi:M23/M56 family metallopeptidase [Intestinimonas timonensis]|uniref:M23/M56 family metallopeptidase n=1 Tax=Intestinimonas timonensis TaxID=1689270 RepID=UPI001F5FA891|nr:M23/M56 family metallopeptidase [Intestinimonas timonensis]